MPETPPTQSSRLWRVLKRPLWKTVTIPDDACVDPDRFSEDEFPVHCLTCGYLLRGLPAGRCPECGEEFERGHLLVEQYVRGRPSKNDRRVRLGRWCFAVGMTLILGFIAATLLIRYTFDPGIRNISAATNVLIGLVLVKLVGVLLSATGMVLASSSMCPNKAKKSRVLDAIEQEDDETSVAWGRAT